MFKSELARFKLIAAWASLVSVKQPPCIVREGAEFNQYFQDNSKSDLFQMGASRKESRILRQVAIKPLNVPIPDVPMFYRV